MSVFTPTKQVYYFNYRKLNGAFTHAPNLLQPHELTAIESLHYPLKTKKQTSLTRKI